MPEFTYLTITQNKQVSGKITAESRNAAIALLRQQNIKPIKVEARKIKKGNVGLFAPKVKLRDLVIFTRELSTMVSAGVPLPRSLSTLAAQTENKYFQKVINDITKDIEGGTPLADAFEKNPKVFSEVYVNMVRAGEAGGILDEILKRLATQVEKDASIRKKIKGAMAYPVVMLVTTITAFFGIMLVIVPKIGKIFKDLGGPNAQLPVYTRAMLQVSDFLAHGTIMQKIPGVNKIPIIGSLPNAVLIIGLMFVLLIYLRRVVRTEKGAYQFHKFLLQMPIFGEVLRKIMVARFSRTFSSLMGAGVSVLDALDVTGKAVGNKVIQRELQEIALKVKNGQPLGKQLLDSKAFPQIVGQMISVGEETGKIDQILLKVADFYEEEVDTVIDSLASIIEPVMIIILGGLVGLIAASVMGPIANLSKQVGG